MPGFGIDYEQEPNTAVSILMTLLVNFATAGLMLTGILTFIAGTSLLDPLLATNPALAPLLKASTLVQVIVLNQNLWFSFPALLLLGIGFFNKG